MAKAKSNVTTKAKVRVPHLYSPRPYQLNMMTFLERGFKRYLGVMHRRAGKDKTGINLIIKQMVKRPAAYYHFFPEYRQARKAIWDAIDPTTGVRFLDHFPKELLAKKPNDTDMKVNFRNGAIYQLVGTDKYDSVMGTAPAGCLFSEYSLQDPRAWDYVRPILSENGGWAAFIYTFRGRNHGWKLYENAKNNKDWFSEIVTVNDSTREDGSPVITLEEIEKERLSGMDEALVQQEYYCSPEGYATGAYYGKQISTARQEGRITSVPWTSGHEVYTFWDLGYDDSTTIWFAQMVGREIRFIDYYENFGHGFEHYSKVLKEKAYVYGDHYMPHDVKVHDLSASGNRNRMEVAEDLGIRPVIAVSRPRNLDAMLEDIETVRNILSQCWIDEKKCARGLSALEGYEAEYDEKKRILSSRPKHNWCSHGASAFATFARGFSPRSDKISMKDMYGVPYTRDAQYAGTGKFRQVWS